MKGQKTLFSKQSDDWDTPQWLFDELNKEFHFVFDLAANEENKKTVTFCNDIDYLDRHLAFGTHAIQFCNQDNRFVWCNPPYSMQRKFFEFSIKHKVPTVFLLPARTDTRLFHDLIYPYSNLIAEGHLYSNRLKENIKVSFKSNYKTEIRFLKGRLKFKRGIAQIKSLEEEIEKIKAEIPLAGIRQAEILIELEKLEKKLNSNDGAAFPSMIVIYRPDDEYTSLLNHTKCKACGKTRNVREINTFKHPVISTDDLIICGYHHFNYCYDSLSCYVKASMRDELIKSE